MLNKVSIGKGISIVFVISMFGMGAPSLPLAYAANDDSSSQSIVENDQNANELSKLEIEGIAFDQSVSPGVFQYTATVENNVQNVTLQVKSDNEKATITVNGQTVDADGSLQSLPLQTGDNQISITVDDGVHTAATYHLTVTRKKSNNNLLQDLQLSAGELSPAFDPKKTSYTAQVADDVNALTVKPIAEERTASIKVNGTLLTDQGVIVQLPTDKTEIAVLVTAENGDQKTYTMEVTKTAAKESASTPVLPSGSSGVSSRNQNSNVTHLKNTGSFSFRNVSTGASQMQGSQQGSAAVQKPSMATLSSLSVSTGTWNKTFSKDTFTYHIAVGNGIDSVTISGNATYSGAAVTIGDGASNSISLGTQKKTIVPVVVTKDDERKTYILVFDKDVPETPAIVADTQTVSSNTQVADTPIKKSKSMSMNNNWNGKNTTNSESTSFWSRLIEGIRSFFSKL